MFLPLPSFGEEEEDDERTTCTETLPTFFIPGINGTPRCLRETTRTRIHHQNRRNSTTKARSHSPRRTEGLSLGTRIGTTTTTSTLTKKKNKKKAIDQKSHESLSRSVDSLRKMLSEHY
uniref:Uncharacterized protein n=1 Tax=Cyclophora tenuis TaxID=216820 RepID=A0A7S1CZH3_CYCTE